MMHHGKMDLWIHGSIKMLRTDNFLDFLQITHASFGGPKEYKVIR